MRNRLPPLELRPLAFCTCWVLLVLVKPPPTSVEFFKAKSAAVNRPHRLSAGERGAPVAAPPARPGRPQRHGPARRLRDRQVLLLLSGSGRTTPRAEIGSAHV